MAKLTSGEECISREHELIHSSPQLYVKQEYFKITFGDGAWCICEPKDFEEMTIGAVGYTSEKVQMTEAEFNALSEFQG